ncbi:MAG: F0F1 ATP synthase subunit A [Alphaproteobacteria bacterium]|nr:F0F1 ATP synthase subunit A [Alphaproteobacteria bacterium]
MIEQEALGQFAIKPLIPIKLGGYDLSFTNSALFMVVAVALATFLFTFAMRKRAVVPGRGQSLAELSYEFVYSLVKEQIGDEGKRFFPFVFSLFFFILFGNLIGLVPGFFTFTSHIIVTFGLAAVVFVLITVVALAIHGTHFFSYFLPEGVPKALAPLIVVVELISYLSRPVSLSIRLFANMMAGHTMLKVFAIFTVVLGGATFFVGGALPLAVNVALYALEFLVAMLQAYVFTILTCIYLHDAVHLH